MKLELTARETELMLALMVCHQAYQPTNPDYESIIRKLEAVILEQNNATAAIAAQYTQAPLFPRSKALPEA